MRPQRENALDRARARSSGLVRRLAPAAWLLAAVLLVMMLVVWPSLAAYFAIASLPTIAMALVDDDGDRRGVVCVGVLNLAGSLPFVLLTVTGQIKTSPLLWGAAYFYSFTGAAIGAALYFAIPMVARRIAKVEEQREAQRLSERQQVLVDEWGANVSTVKLDFTRSDDAR
jgi:4-hydroxybenzoate polyprenyltransferase